MKLLHVDHDTLFAKAFRVEMLRHIGVLCDLDQANTTNEAIERIRQERYDGILLNPFVSTTIQWEDCQRIHETAPGLPLLALTDVNDTRVAVAAIQAGATDFLVKDESPMTWLMRRVRFAIERNKYQANRHLIRGPHSRVAKHAKTLARVGHSTSESWNESSGGDNFQLERELPTEVEAVPCGTVRVLHVEDDPTIARMARKFLSQQGPYTFVVEHAASLNEAQEVIQQQSFDAWLLDLSLPDQLGIETLSKMIPLAGETPILVLSGRDEDSVAIEAMQAGADDFLIKGDMSMRYLARAVSMSVARRTCRQTLDHVEPTNAEPVTESLIVGEMSTETPCLGSPTISNSDRRQHSRYLLTKPVYAIPILPDRSPAEAQTADGISVDMSAGGIKLQLGGLERLPTKYLLVGVEAHNATLHFATVEARRVTAMDGGLDIGGRFVTDEHDLISRDNLEPLFRAESRTFATGLPFEVLNRWCEIGIFRPILFDKVLVCPQCQAVTTFRKGCRVCGSVRLHTRPLIHHFACAHVGFVTDFEQNGMIACPKCRTKNMIVGADFEHLNGPFRCLDCDWSDTELDLVGQCLRCETRFPSNQAVEEDLIGYHVERLDPLAFVDAT